MIILAGVSINLILSDNGLIKKANLAKKRSNSSKLIENIQNAWNECIIMSNESGQEEQEYFEENFLQVLESNDINVTEIAININGTSIVKVKKDDRIIIYCISSIDGQDFLKIENNNINTSTLDNLSSYWVFEA